MRAFPFVGELLSDFSQLGDTAGQHIDILAAWHAQAVQRSRYPLLEHLLEFVPGSGRLRAHLCDSLIGDRLGPLLELLAFSDEGFEHLRAFLLGLGECTKPGEPDLIGRLSHFRGQLSFRHLMGEISEKVSLA